MKMLWFAPLYTEVYSELNRFNHSYKDLSFNQQNNIIRQNLYFSNFFIGSMVDLGYEVFEIPYNNSYGQKSWAKENGLDYNKISNFDIMVLQAKKINPDILFFECNDLDTLKRIKKQCPNIKLVFGWSGSAIGRNTAWGEMNAILCCAPESVEKIKKLGYESFHINHGFDPNILNKITFQKKDIDLLFTGSVIITNTKGYHSKRLEFLMEIYSKCVQCGIDFQIFGKVDFSGRLIKAKLNIYKFLSVFGLGDLFLKFSGKDGILIKKGLDLSSIVHPPVFGINMYNLIKRSKVALNIHADSSDKFASNIRLFEVTGVGACLLTDYKENMPNLFSSKEVICYNSTEDCIDKIKELFNDTSSIDSLALLGQKRTLKQHTTLHRAKEFDKIIKILLKKVVK
ncbi:MAG: glycosyltransferase [Sphaerochaetaceae bacterium]|nr:glycosyltransferase [Sphaerochaetaceae bacterium]